MRSALTMTSSRWAITTRVTPRSWLVRLSLTIAWVTLSRALVASSSSRILGRRTIARAISSRCRWPLERFPPPSPTSVCIPIGIRRMSSSRPASRAASQASSIVQAAARSRRCC